MDLTNPKTIKQILREYKIFPNKKLGQHFVIDRRLINELISLANIQKNDIILEIGPGLGAVTQNLLKKAARVIAVEIDKGLSTFLKDQFSSHSNFILIQNDILSLPENQLPDKYKLIANLPFQITSRFLENFLWRLKTKPQVLSLGVQKELADRIAAKSPQMNRLALLVRANAQLKKHRTYLPSSFYPPPAVKTTLIQLTPKTFNKKERAQITEALEIAKMAYGQKRKKLINSLSSLGSKKQLAACLKKVGRPPSARPQELTLKNWLELLECLKEN